MPRRQQFVPRDLSGSFAQRLDCFDRLVNFRLPKVRLGHDPGDGPPVSRDNDGLAALDIVEQLGDALWRPKPEPRACCVPLFGWSI